MYSFGRLVPDTGLSRRQFLKGAGAAVGAMKLPAVEQAMDNEQLVDAIYETMNNGGEFLTTLFKNIPNNIKGLLKIQNTTMSILVTRLTIMVLT